ncbi:MAG: hypothetical protein KGQ54_02710 [Verrucomicrobia bacterium]|nr:hypothetical protein [Verrucomicrobiota bacterium]
MVNTISSTNGAGTANPTPQEINRFLVPLSFLERISLIVKGIFSKESFKSLCGIKYGIKPDYIKFQCAAKTALKVIDAKKIQIRRSDLEAYLCNFALDITVMRLQEKTFLA